MITRIKGDIVTVTEGIIVQQVNCQGVMGAGLAKQLRDKWPVVYDNYKKKWVGGDINNYVKTLYCL